jgi:hypothetical protein
LKTNGRGDYVHHGEDLQITPMDGGKAAIQRFRDGEEVLKVPFHGLEAALKM